MEWTYGVEGKYIKKKIEVGPCCLIYPRRTPIRTKAKAKTNLSKLDVIHGGKWFGIQFGKTTSILCCC
jgi:hypothetical protein